MRRRALASAFACVAAALAGHPASAADAPRDADIEARFAAADAGDLEPLEAVQGRLAAPAVRALVEARLHAARFEDAAAQSDLRRYFALGDPDRTRQGLAWSIADDAAFAEGDYAAAAKASGRWLDFMAKDDPRRPDTLQAHAIETLLTGAPRQQVLQSRPVPVALTRNRIGLMEAKVTINGAGQAAILDTGADISTLSASAAKRLKVRMLDGAGSVGSPTRDAVPVRLGVADHVEIGGVTLAHVVFLVLDDSQLRLPVPGGFQIDAIIGLPVFRALGRVEFGPGGRFASGAAADPPAPHGAPLRSVGADLFVTVRLAGLDVPLHLDTGATSSDLSPLFARRHPELLAGLKRESDHIAGAGGTAARDIAIWADPTIGLGDRTLHPAQLTITVADSSGSGAKRFGVLGGDLLGQVCSYVLDFHRAVLEPGALRGPAGCQTRAHQPAHPRASGNPGFLPAAKQN